MREVKERFPETRGLVVARVLVAVVVVLTSLVGRASIHLPSVVALAVVAAAASAVYLFLDRTGRAPDALFRVQVGVDVVLITLLVYFSGGLASPFKLLYFLPVIVASSRLGVRTGTAVAGASAVGYLVQTVREPSGFRLLEEPGIIAEITILIVALLLVATLVGYLARVASERERDLAHVRSELEEARLRLASIVDGIPSGLAIVGRDGRLVRLNRVAEAILGIAEEGALGNDYRLVFADVPAFCERIASALEAGRAEFRTEFFVRRRHGGNVPVGLSTSVLKDDRGNERGVVAIFQDLTEVRRLEERSRQDDRLSALGQFAAGVAHEIRNPLNAIKGAIDLLRDIAKPSGDEARLVDLVSREADRLNDFVRDVLQFGRLESGERENVRLDRIVEDVAASSRNHPSRKPGVEVAAAAPEPVEAYVNADAIKRALLNLATNALESIEERGTVRISLLRDAEFTAHGLEGGPDCDVALVVEDTGCGIPPEKREGIFQPFATTKKGGTGLGLAIVDKIVRSHGGRITVTSEPGRGSRFVVYLPV
jgi:two-component system sensor histidine kinase PilS (NtrC family)